MANWRGAELERLAAAGSPPTACSSSTSFNPRPRALSLRPSRHVGLDRPAFLHRRHHAQPRADAAVPRPLPRDAKLGLVRHALRPHGARLAGPVATPIARRSSGSSPASTAPTPRCGSDAGGCSSSPPRGCSATTAGRTWGVTHLPARADGVLMSVASATKRLYVGGRDRAAHHVRSPDRAGDARQHRRDDHLDATCRSIRCWSGGWSGARCGPTFLQFLAWPLFLCGALRLAAASRPVARTVRDRRPRQHDALHQGVRRRPRASAGFYCPAC